MSSHRFPPTGYGYVTPGIITVCYKTNLFGFYKPLHDIHLHNVYVPILTSYFIFVKSF